MKRQNSESETSPALAKIFSREPDVTANSNKHSLVVLKSVAMCLHVRVELPLSGELLTASRAGEVLRSCVKHHVLLQVVLSREGTRAALNRTLKT